MVSVEQIEKHKSLYAYLCIFAFLFINNTINASTVWIEYSRTEHPTISMWEPFVWEYTSAISTLILLPVLLYFFRIYPPKMTQIRRQIFRHFIASIIYSASHVAIMVLLRIVIYQFTNGHYEFGNWALELWYEYQKDAWGYVLFYVGFHIIRSLYARLKGEANLITESEDQEKSLVAPKHFLVKKLDKEFLIKTADIEWLESFGNYVNLHSNGRIYPYRSTLTVLIERLNSSGFSRIHRSHAINHNAISHISYQQSGDGEVTLTSGKTLKLSRRYKDEFKQSIN